MGVRVGVFWLWVWVWDLPLYSIYCRWYLLASIASEAGKEEAEKTRSLDG